MAEPAGKTGQITTLLPQENRYRPLGAKIAKIEYQFPAGIGPEEMLIYIRGIEEEVQRGDVRRLPYFYDPLGLSTANMESFKANNPDLWRALKESVKKIADRLLTSNTEKSKSVATDLLRPFAYREISDDPDHLWGYLAQTVNPHRIPTSLPLRCAMRDEKENANTLLRELNQDLVESFERRADPKVWVPASNQCNEPYQPMRYRLEAGLDGPSTMEEGGEAVFDLQELSVLEYGEGFGFGEPTPTERKISVDRFTCNEEPTLESIEGNRVVLKAPAVLHQNCKALLRFETKGPYGTTVTATKEVEMLDTKNEAPSIHIQEKRDGIIVKLKAKANDADGDKLTYRWEQIKGLPVIFQGGLNSSSIEFFNPTILDNQEQKVAFRITVTDPTHSVQAVHQMTFKPLVHTKTPEEVATDPKRKGLLEISKKRGGKPKVAVTADDLLKKIKEAAVPQKTVDFIDLVVVIDASGSMVDNIEEVKKRVPQLVEEMRRKVKSKKLADVRVGITSYVDNKNVQHLELTTADQNRLDEKLDEAIQRIRKPSMGLETVWDALYTTIRDEPWHHGAGGFRRVVYITDAEGNTGKLGKTEADVDQISEAQDVVVEPIFFEWESVQKLFERTSLFNYFNKKEIFNDNEMFINSYSKKKEFDKIISNPNIQELIFSKFPNKK